jgi:PAS domain S-box-containing protein
MRILHIEDNLEDAELVKELLDAEWPRCEVHVISKRSELVDRLGKTPYDLVLSDFSLGAFTGLDALRLVRERHPDTPFVFLSGTIGEDRAIEALKAGAQDYVIKDRMKRLVTAIHRAIRDCRETSRRQAAERRCRELAEVLDRASDGIIVTDLENRVTFWNKGAERISGWTAEEAAGRSPEELLGVTVHPEIANARAAVERTGEWRGELDLKARDGRYVFLEMSIALVRDGDGNPVAKLSIATDVTEKRSIEEKFLRVQRLESIGLLAAGIAHDLNNVLLPIMMAAPMLKANLTDPGDLEIISTLESSAERGAGLVRQILSFAQGVSGGKQLVQMRHLIRDLSGMMHEAFPKSIELRESIQADLHLVYGNPTHLHQVLMNLCVNARDAMPGGGRLILNVENAVLDEASARAIPGASPGSWVVIHVEDTGTGIPPEVLPRIWEPFFTTKGQGKGTGLGLSTVRGIVDGHKGFIDLRTEQGKGTVFRVYLPAAEASAPPDEARGPAVPELRGNGELILVVDDKLEVREIAATTLTHFGYRVVVAVDGIEALEKFSQHRGEVRVLLTDLNMPNLDGSSLSGLVAEFNPGVKVLMMSGADSGERRKQKLDFKGSVLTKPFKTGELLLAIRDLLKA